MIKTLKQFVHGYIPYYYTKLTDPHSEKLNYYKYIKNKYYTHFPTYDFVSDYFSMDIKVTYDEKKDLHYVVHHGKKLYFPKKISKETIAQKYKCLLIEQDIRYPHCYVKSMEEFRGKTLLDIGSAEGMSSLDAIEVVDFIYLFEFEEEWIEVLKATFEPWSDKIMIIQKYISNTINETTDSLDNFMKDKSLDNLFIKMDIEGEECNALSGARYIFENSTNLAFAICTYHKKNDFRDISKFLDHYNYTYIAQKYMYFKHKVRVAILKGQKNKSVC